MSTPEQTQALSLGRPGEPCEECGAPLAIDQRYCLNCGSRRGEPRVDYRRVMAAGGSEAPTSQPPQPPGEAEPPKAGRGERDFAPLAAVAGIAVLGLMLLVGVLIGKGNAPAASTGTPQVVRVPAAEGTAEASSGGSEGGSSEPAGGGKAKKGAKDSSGGKGESKTTGLEGGGANDDSVHEVSSSELEELESESGEAAAEKSLDLPNKIATPGAPPPIDKSKPPGGGEGGGLVIK